MQKTSTYIFIFLVLFISNISKNFAQVNASDSLTLVNLYNNTNGANWTNKSGWLTGPVVNWYGVGLSGNDVISISLSNNNLHGTIPASLGNISLLSYLDLSGNHLTGNIPYSLGNTNLNTLYLSNNQLSGVIPGTIGNLAILGDLELNNNNLTGSIPDSLQTLFSLSYLDLSTNQLSGNIPSYLGTLPNLNNLFLYSNALTGSIPASLASSTTINSLNLSSNQLSNSIPSGLGSSAVLTGINLSHNQLSGIIPAALGNPNLFFLDISHNLLTGTIPASFTTITSNLSPTSTAINNNKLTYDGLEVIVQSPDFNPGLLSDSQQAIIPLHRVGNVLSVYAGGSLAKDTFYWYKNGVLNNTIIGDSTYTFTASGNYSVVIANAVVSHITGLKLYSDTFSAVILPVTFLNFTGSLENYIAQLQWQTAEINTAYYNVQRSIDGIDFTTIATINASGNNASIQNYQYPDNLSTLIGQPKNLYYRLQEVDKDGQVLFSKIVNIPLSTSSSAAINVYPNPVSNILNVDLNNNGQNVLIVIFDATGKKQSEQMQNSNHININTSGLPAGEYFIQISLNGVISNRQFIKE